jgi:hypothetical protein
VRSGANNPTTVTVHVPMTFVLRGGRKVIEGPDTGPEGLNPSHEALRAQSQPKRSNNALLKALVRAHRWRRMIETGQCASITELAKTENVNQSYACRMLRLTLLAPAVVVDVLNETCTSDLMLKQFMKPFPVQWDKQRVASGRIGRA